MASPDNAPEFVSGNARLDRILSDPELRARVDAILAEQQVIDDRHRDAVQTLRSSAATLVTTIGIAAPADTLDALQRHLTDAGVREVGITLTYSDHEVTVPLDQILAATDS